MRDGRSARLSCPQLVSRQDLGGNQASKAEEGRVPQRLREWRRHPAFVYRAEWIRREWKGEEGRREVTCVAASVGGVVGEVCRRWSRVGERSALSAGRLGVSWAVGFSCNGFCGGRSVRAHGRDLHTGLRGDGIFFFFCLKRRASSIHHLQEFS